MTELNKSQKITLLATILISVLLYYFFGWTTSVNSDDNFAISHPYNWEHRTLQGKEFWDMADKTITDGECRSMSESGGCFVEGIVIEVYKASDKDMTSKQDFANFFSQPVPVVIGGIETKEVVTESRPYNQQLTAGPIEHKGNMYYFSGSNTPTVKRMLQSFRFTK